MQASDFLAVALFAPVAAALLAVLTGWGRLVRRILPVDAGPAWAVDAWSGWAAGTVFLQGWHLALPVDWRAAAVMGVVGLAGWWRAGAWRPPRVPPRDRPGAVATAVVCLVLFALMVRHVRSDLQVYDAGMYYFQAVRWMNEHPVVPGLGNLSMQLGINQSYFLWAALLNLSPLWVSGFMVVNCLTFAVAMAPGVREMVRLRRSDPPPDAPGLLRILTVPLLLALGMNDGTATPSPDVFASVLCVVVFDQAAAWLAIRGPARPPYHVVLLCAALVTVKLSMVVYAGALTLVVAVVHAVRAGRDPAGGGLLRPTAVAMTIALVAGVPWAARNVMTTGYPLFPSPVAPCPVAWRIPGHRVAFVADYIRAWARHPGADGRDFRDRLAAEQTRILLREPGAMTPGAFRELVRGTPWFSGWLADSLRSPLWVTGMAGSLLAGIALAGLRRRARGKPDAGRCLDPLYVPLLAAIVFWFHTAPAIRFGIPFFLLLLALPAAQLVLRLPFGPAGLRRTVAAAAWLLAAVSLAGGYPPRSRLWADIVVPQRVIPDMRPFTTHSGLVVLMPVHDVRSFDAPLPSTSVRNPFLSLLDPERGIGGGFRDDTPPPAPGL
jgi:hypothetical protein